LAPPPTERVDPIPARPFVIKAAPTQWAAELLAKKPYKVVAVALANKMARIAWALMITGKSFEASAAA
jgi:transposase